MERKMINITIWGVLLAIAVILMVDVMSDNNEINGFSKKAVKATAMVDRITTERGLVWHKVRRGRTRLSYRNIYVAYVTYEVNGIEYNNVKVKATTKMEEGETAEIYYNSDEPRNAKSSADLVKHFPVSLLFIIIAEMIIVWSIYTDRLDFKWLEFLKGGLDK